MANFVANMATFGATFGETLATLGSTLNTFLATFGYKLSYFGVAFGRKLGNFLFQHWVTPKETGKSIKSILCHILDDDIIMVTHISSSQSTIPSSSMFDHLLHILWSLHLLWPLVFSSLAFLVSLSFFFGLLFHVWPPTSYPLVLSSLDFSSFLWLHPYLVFSSLVISFILWLLNSYILTFLAFGLSLVFFSLAFCLSLSLSLSLLWSSLLFWDFLILISSLVWPLVSFWTSLLFFVFLHSLWSSLLWTSPQLIHIRSSHMSFDVFMILVFILKGTFLSLLLIISFFSMKVVQMAKRRAPRTGSEPRTSCV